MQKHKKTNDFGTKQQNDEWNHDSLLLDEMSNTEISSCCALVAEDSDDGSLSSDNNNNKQVSNSSRILIGDAIIKLGHGRFQRQLIFVVGLCLASDALEVTLLAYLSAVLRYEWNLSSLETATITSSVFAGQLLGTLILGPLGDRYGRRPIILVSSVMISTFGCLTATATTFTSLIVIRTILGFGIGGFVVPFDILAEFLSSEVRGKYLLAVEYFWTFGTLLVSVVASATIGGRDSSSSGWQTFVIACAMPSILAAFFAYWWIPESPQWLATQGRSAEAFQILRHAASINGKNPLLLFPRNLETLSFDSKFSDDGDHDDGNDSSIKYSSSSAYVSCMSLFQVRTKY
jgi:MFS family permease